MRAPRKKYISYLRSHITLKMFSKGLLGYRMPYHIQVSKNTICPNIMSLFKIPLEDILKVKWLRRNEIIFCMEPPPPFSPPNHPAGIRHYIRYTYQYLNYDWLCFNDIEKILKRVWKTIVIINIQFLIYSK